MSHTSDEKLIDIFERAYDEHSDAIFRFLNFKLSDRERAKELMQETFMKTWIYMAEGKEVHNMRAFLYRSARNLFINEIRTDRRMLSLDKLEEEQGFEVGSEHENEYIDSLDSEEVVERIRNIHDSYKEVLLMRYVDDLPVNEIADILGETENNISVRIHRGLKKLREIYEAEEIQ